MILFFIGLFVIAIFVVPIVFTYKHMSGILEMDHPSFSIKQSREKNIFVDTLFVLHPDTIRVNDSADTFDILPISAWMEKKAYWKSKTPDLDSIAFLADTLDLVVNFQPYKEGKLWKPKHRFNIDKFNVINGGQQSVYIDSEIAQLAIKMHVNQLKDTVVITAPHGQQILLKR